MLRTICIKLLLIAMCYLPFTTALADQPFYVLTPDNPIPNKTYIYTKGDYRYIESNGIPIVHGTFPAPNNRGYIMSQNYHFRMTVNPTISGKVIPLTETFGVTLEGIPFIPYDAEFWKGDSQSGWHYVAMQADTPTLDVNIDFNNGHVHPIGVYHYHGLPLALYNKFSQYRGAPKTMVLIGYAADGFPIYGLYGHDTADNAQSPLIKLRSSYQLKSGNRPASGPKGKYDGTFVQDYHYVKGAGELDECNGRSGVTPEYPKGTYYYVISERFPTVPRCFKGTPDDSFSPQAIASAAPTTYSECVTLDTADTRLAAGCPTCDNAKMPQDQRDMFCPKNYKGR